MSEIVARTGNTEISSLIFSPTDGERVKAQESQAQTESKARRNRVVVAFVVLLTLLIGFWPAFDLPAMPMDEGTLLVYPELVA